MIKVSPTPRAPVADRPWQSYITVDTINTVLQRTILHPFIAWMIPLSLRAQYTPWHFLEMKISIAYATLLTFYWIFTVFDKRIAYGIPRDVDLEEEVIVITGGASGLGLLIAEVYGMRGANVAVLDVEEVENAEDKGIQSYKCDVGSKDQVEEAARQIEQDLGPVTILINNAGVVNGKPLLELSSDDVERTIRTNLLSHFNTTQTFLPTMLEEGRGTIVTVSSVLGHLGAANLTDYAASKAGLLAFHSSLRAELDQSSHPNAEWIRTVLCIPGQMSTPLFGNVKTPSNFLAPVVEPIELAKGIIQMVENGVSGEVTAPLYTHFVGWYGVLPAGVQKLVRRWSGIDKAIAASRSSKVGA